MIKLEKISTKNLRKQIGLKISSYLDDLDGYNSADKQKQLELCQIGKTIATYFPEFKIKEMREQPDFIISNGNNEYGLEHELILNTSIKSYQGFYENIFHIAEHELQNDSNLPNFLANCFLKPNLNFQTKDKKKLVRMAKEIVTHSIKENTVPPNELIDRVFHMPHSSKNLAVNFGAHIVEYLTENVINNFIEKKESKIEKYIQNTQLQQWLILIAGGVHEYSYRIPKTLNIKIPETKFHNIFLLGDFDYTLYKIK